MFRSRVFQLWLVGALAIGGFVWFAENGLSQGFRPRPDPKKGLPVPNLISNLPPGFPKSGFPFPIQFGGTKGGQGGQQGNQAFGGNQGNQGNQGGNQGNQGQQGGQGFTGREMPPFGPETGFAGPTIQANVLFRMPEVIGGFRGFVDRGGAVGFNQQQGQQGQFGQFGQFGQGGGQFGQFGQGGFGGGQFGLGGGQFGQGGFGGGQFGIGGKFGLAGMMGMPAMSNRWGL